MPEDLDINIKQYIREFLNNKMLEARGSSKHFSVSPGIIIRDTNNETEMEGFIDDLWYFISKRNLQDKKDESNGKPTL